MSIIKLMLFAGLLCFLPLTGCAETTATQNTSSTPSATVVGSAPATSASTNVALVSGSSTTSSATETTDWRALGYTTIDLANGSATIVRSGVYEIIGVLKEGSLIVDIDKSADQGTVYLVLNNASISSPGDTPLNILDAQEVVIILEKGTTNTVTQGQIETTDEDFPSAAIFSKADTIIEGSGSLSVTTSYNDGITSKDDLIIKGGVIQVTAAGDGIVGKDLLQIDNATIEITAGKDGLRSTNSEKADRGMIVIHGGTFTIEAVNDAIQAETTLTISGGIFDLSSGGGFPGESTKSGDAFGQAFGMPQTSAETEASESRKALKAQTELEIFGGSFNISAYEDALHSNGTIIIHDGLFTIECGDDGIHADRVLIISDGVIDLRQSFESIESTEVTINGGTISLVSSDDGINISSRTGTLTINGGRITIKSVGDAIDSNGNLTINGGATIIHKSGIGPADEALDYDGVLTFTGGTIVDQNGNTIDPTLRSSPGGRGGIVQGGRRTP